MEHPLFEENQWRMKSIVSSVQYIFKIPTPEHDNDVGFSIQDKGLNNG